MVRIVQITDSHVTAANTLWKDQVDTAGRLAAQVAATNRLGADLVVHTGDVVETGHRPEGAAEYQEAARILKDLQAPLRILPGNHDGRHGLRAAFPDQIYDTPSHLCVSLRLSGLHIIGLDSLVEGQTGGALDHAQLDWLGTVLDDRPTLMFVHHPPCPMGLPFMDGFGFDGADALAPRLRGAQVLRICCGHVHCDVSVHWADTVVAAADASSVHISPDMPAFDALPPGTPRMAGVEPLRLRVFDWVDGTLSVKTIPADPAPDRAVL